MYLRAETESFVAGFVALACCALATAILILLTPGTESRNFKSVTSELTAAWQVQFRFDCLHNLLWGSSQFDR